MPSTSSLSMEAPPDSCRREHCDFVPTINDDPVSDHVKRDTKNISASVEVSIDSRSIFQYMLKYEKAPGRGGFSRSRAGQSS